MNTYKNKYKNSLEKMKGFYIYCKRCENKDTVAFLEDIFPELKESEDERIRKWLIAQLQIKISDDATLNNMIYKAIAWLEKQGEHTIACSEEQMRVLDEILNFAANHESPYWNDYIFGTLSNFIRQLKNINRRINHDTRRKSKSL